MTEIQGFCDEQFSAVGEQFAKNFKEGDAGASVCLSLEGEIVVDLWGGHSDRGGNTAWQEDTIINVYSTTKTMAAMSLLLLADREQVDLYSPVTNYWPEYGQNGKEKTQVRHFLSHSAGLSGMDEPMQGEDFYDWDKVVTALAAQAPWWEPGSQSGYHALTQGHLIGEVVRRVSGKSIGQFFADEIAGPLNADFHIGTKEEHWDRVAELIPPEGGAPASDAGADSIAARTFKNPGVDARAARTPGWRLAEIPAANGHGNARSVVRAQTPMANGGKAFGVEIMSQAGTQRIFDKQISGDDLVLGVPITFGMGYGLTSEVMPMGPNEHIGYWGGWGGSSIVVDQDAHMCLSYVMNKMYASLLGDTRGFNLLQAAYKSL